MLGSATDIQMENKQVSLFLRKSSRERKRKGACPKVAEGVEGQLQLDFSGLGSSVDHAIMHAAQPTACMTEETPGQWSSTENNSNNAWVQRFNDGNQNNNNKNNSYLVRCVRSSVSPPAIEAGTSQSLCNTVYPRAVPDRFASPAAALSWLELERRTPKERRRFFPEVDHPEVEVSEVFRAYRNCAKGKAKKPDKVAFDMQRERSLMGIYYALRERDWQPLPSKVFAVHKPKPREIWAAPFADRVVHHIAHARIESGYTRAMSAKTFACMPGRGIHAAMRNVRRGLRRATVNHQAQAWVLKLDLSNFFQAIDLPMLWAVLERDGVLDDPLLAYVFSQLLFNQQRSKARVVSAKAIMRLVPPKKSLLRTPLEKGLPIGNLTSQWLANIYMTPLDKYIESEIRPLSYTRYVDDLVLIDPDIDKLKKAAQQIEAVLGEARMSLNPTKTKLFPGRHGIDAFGFFVLPGRTYVRHCTYRRIARKCTTQRQKLKNTQLADEHRVHALLSMGSYLGIFNQASSEMPYALREVAKIGFSPNAYGLNIAGSSSANSKQKNQRKKKRRSFNKWQVLFRAI